MNWKTIESGILIGVFTFATLIIIVQIYKLQKEYKRLKEWGIKNDDE